MSKQTFAIFAIAFICLTIKNTNAGRVTVNFPSATNGMGTLSFNGNTYACRGMVGFDYDTDITLRSSDAYKSKYSSEYNVYMKWAVGPIQWSRGAYIHQGSLSSSVGCIKLNAGPAKALYDYVKDNTRTRVTIDYKW